MLCCHGAQTCRKHALDPADAQQRAQHSAACEARHARLASLAGSREVECAICMERVLDKAAPAERKFGLLDCDHAFCLGCIRGWRAHTDGGADMASVRGSPSPASALPLKGQREHHSRVRGFFQRPGITD